MSFEVLFVFGVIGAAMFLFAPERIPYDLVAMAIMVALMLSRFSNPATVTIAAMFVLSRSPRGRS